MGGIAPCLIKITRIAVYNYFSKNMRGANMAGQLNICFNRKHPHGFLLLKVSPMKRYHGEIP